MTLGRLRYTPDSSSCGFRQQRKGLALRGKAGHVVIGEKDVTKVEHWIDPGFQWLFFWARSRISTSRSRKRFAAASASPSESWRLTIYRPLTTCHSVQV